LRYSIICIFFLIFKLIKEIQKRTGIKDSEIDEFLAKASALEEAIKNIKDGKFNSEDDINIPGFETEEERNEKYVCRY